MGRVRGWRRVYIRVSFGDDWGRGGCVRLTWAIFDIGCRGKN